MGWGACSGALKLAGGGNGSGGRLRGRASGGGLGGKLSGGLGGRLAVTEHPSQQLQLTADLQGTAVSSEALRWWAWCDVLGKVQHLLAAGVVPHLQSRLAPWMAALRVTVPPEYRVSLDRHVHSRCTPAAWHTARSRHAQGVTLHMRSGCQHDARGSDPISSDQDWLAMDSLSGMAVHHARGRGISHCALHAQSSFCCKCAVGHALKACAQMMAP